MATTADQSPLERLLAESIPTGTFGHARPKPTRHREAQSTRSAPNEQARRWAALEAALGGREARGPKHRHLRVVRDEAA